MTSYTIVKIHKTGTIIREYWDDLPVFTYRCQSVYHGGSIPRFLEEHKVFRIPNFEAIEEFNRRHNILNF